MKTEIVIVPFHGDVLTAIEAADSEYVALRPICERLGLDWKSQHRKLAADPKLWSVVMMTMETPAGPRESTCIPRNRTAAWLLSITPAKVKPELREALSLYRTEAADVLDRHFRLRAAERDQELERLRRLRDQLTAFACAFNPLWGRILSLCQAGVTRGEVRRFLPSKPQAEVWTAIDTMERVGVLDREGWRPSMFPWFDERPREAEPATDEPAAAPPVLTAS